MHCSTPLPCAHTLLFFICAQLPATFSNVCELFTLLGMVCVLCPTSKKNYFSFQL